MAASTASCSSRGRVTSPRRLSPRWAAADLERAGAGSRGEDCWSAWWCALMSSWRREMASVRTWRRRKGCREVIRSAIVAETRRRGGGGREGRTSPAEEFFGQSKETRWFSCPKDCKRQTATSSS